MLAQFMDSVVANLRDADACTQILRECGEKHAVFKESGMRADFWEVRHNKAGKEHA
jgi:hypothetical protein